MQEYTGQQLELGPSKPSGKWRHYTYIKVNGDTISNAYINERFDVILRDQVKRSGNVTLWIIRWSFRPLIIGITQSDGQTFRQSLATQYGFATMCVIMSAGVLLAQGGWNYFLLLTIPSLWLNLKLIGKIRKIPADHIY